jgi:dipeptidyl aminopeptidase/acylaminoacyl peptidase
MLPSDLDALLTLGQPALSPDGTTVAFVLQQVDADLNDYRSQVWLVPVDGSTPPLPFTSGEHQDANPVWSPDSSRLAFTSTRGGDDRHKVTVHVAPVRIGGEVVTLAHFADEVVALRWSPDGRHLALNARTRAERYAEGDERRQPPRRVTRLFSRLDNTGFTVDRPLHVYVVPADGSGRPRNLTPGEHAFSRPEWTPDSRTVLAAGAAHETWDLDLKSDVYALDVASGDRRRVTATTGEYASPSASPDGTRVAFVGTDDVASSPRNMHVGVVELPGADAFQAGALGEENLPRHRWVSHGLDRTFQPFPHNQPPHWLDDSTLLASVEDRGDVHLYRLSADGATPPRPVWSGEGVVTGFDEAGGTVVFVLSTPTSPAELFVLEADGGTRQLTDLTAAYAAKAQLQPYERFTVPASDGSVDIDAWLLRPPGFDPDRSYPMLVNVHGGPFTQYANRFFDEVQIQARAGYVVLWCNPRGGSGREESFGRAICGEPHGGTGWGSVDYDDVMAVVDHVVQTRAYVDPDRLGILGGSYGGYMTSWAVGHTDRFRAACSERAANNLLSLEWASDAAGAFRMFVGKSHLEAPELFQAMSPITYVRDIDTPLLVMHSENDLRCPIEQAEQMFVALRLQEKDVEFVRFPAESHELSRSGSPVHRRQRMEIILDFFAQHLKP